MAIGSAGKCKRLLNFASVGAESLVIASLIPTFQPRGLDAAVLV
jgi:hypothetical protein